MAAAIRLTSTEKLREWDLTLRKDVQTQDVLTGFEGIGTGDKDFIPDATKIIIKAAIGESDRTVTLLLDLTAAGVTGRTSLKTNEETQILRSLVLRANTYRHGVNTEVYGIDAHETKAYSMMEKVNMQLSRWHAQKEGQFIRECLCEVISSNLVDSPVSQTAAINANVLVIDTTLGSTFVTYDSTLADFRTNINSAVDAAPTAEHRLSRDALARIERFASQDAEIAPINVNGTMMWILLVGYRQKEFLMSSSDFSNQLEQADIRGPDNRANKHVMGRFGQLLLIADERAPVVTVAGGAVTFAYKGPSDGRDLTADNDRFDVVVLLGMQSYYEYEFEPLMFREEIEDYESQKGIGAIRTTGWTLSQFDNILSPTDTTIYNKSSALILCGTN